MEVVSGITRAARSPTGVGISSGTGQPNVASVIETKIALKKMLLYIAVKSPSGRSTSCISDLATLMNGRTTSVETISASSNSLPLVESACRSVFLLRESDYNLS